MKEVRLLPFPELERLALEAERQGAQRKKIGLCIVKRRAGRGTETPTLVVMTAEMFREMSGALPGESASEAGYLSMLERGLSGRGVEGR